MALPCVIFRADASISIGSGHVTRCLTLATALTMRGAKVIFVSLAQDGDLIDETERRGYKVLRLSPSLAEVEQVASEEADAASFAMAIQQLASIDGQRMADWIVVDHYGLGEAWQQRVRPYTARIMAIDDLADRRHAVDLLLDQNLVEDLDSRYDTRVDKDCVKLLGPRYALLARNYAALRPRVHRAATKPANILIYFGGADTRLTSLAAQALSRLPQAFLATIVLDQRNDQHGAMEGLVALDSRLKLVGRLPDLAAAMLESDLFIGASGTTSWERLCLGLYAVVVTLADNQVPLACELARRHFVAWLGDARALTLDGLAVAIASAMAAPGRPDRAADMMDIVDGLGVERVCDVLLHDRNGAINLRRATAEDSDQVLAWANDPGTRRYAFSTGAINREVHEGWFAKRLANPDVVFLIAETPHATGLGQVRFERQTNGTWEISYLLAPVFRGRGLARPILAAGIDALARLHPASLVTGLVKRDNLASMSVFSALGFAGTPSPQNADAVRFSLDTAQRG